MTWREIGLVCATGAGLGVAAAYLVIRFRDRKWM